MTENSDVACLEDIELKREVLLCAKSHAALHLLNGDAGPIENAQIDTVYLLIGLILNYFGCFLSFHFSYPS